MSSNHRGTSPRPTPSTTTAQTNSPRSPAYSARSVDDEEAAAIDPGNSDDDDSDEFETDSMADASEGAIEDRALTSLGIHKPLRDTVPPWEQRARSHLSNDGALLLSLLERSWCLSELAELVKEAQRSLLDKVKQATNSDWLRPCPPAYMLPVDHPDDGPDPFPWTDAAFNSAGVTRSLEEMGIDEQTRPTAADVDLSFIDAPPHAFPGMQPDHLSTDVRRLGMF